MYIHPVSELLRDSPIGPHLPHDGIEEDADSRREALPYSYAWVDRGNGAGRPVNRVELFVPAPRHECPPKA
jgi:hypothetical protein